MKSGARWMTKEKGKRLIIRVIHPAKAGLQGFRDFALWAAPLHLRGCWAKISSPFTPLWMTQTN
jgi:hypothetical protein